MRWNSNQMALDVDYGFEIVLFFRIVLLFITVFCQQSKLLLLLERALVQSRYTEWKMISTRYSFPP